MKLINDYRESMTVGTISGRALIVLCFILLVGLSVTSGLPLRAWAGGPGGHENVVFSSILSNVPGSRLTVVVVSYGPGDKSPAHRHAGSVFAYVLSGSIRSENSATGPAHIYATGESFFEPVGSVHLVSENASPTRPAALLAVFVAEDGAQLTMPQHP